MQAGRMGRPVDRVTGIEDQAVSIDCTAEAE
jgi:hypothetical protein